MKIVRNGHGLHGADMGTTGVSDRYPYAREHRRCDDSRGLANNLAPGARRGSEAEHEPMHVNMFQRVPLTEDVGALEMMKRDFDFSPNRRGFGGVQLSLVRMSERWIHVPA